MTTEFDELAPSPVAEGDSVPEHLRDVVLDRVPIRTPGDSALDAALAGGRSSLADDLRRIQRGDVPEGTPPALVAALTKDAPAELYVVPAVVANPAALHYRDDAPIAIGEFPDWCAHGVPLDIARTDAPRDVRKGEPTPERSAAAPIEVHADNLGGPELHELEV